MSLGKGSVERRWEIASHGQEAVRVQEGREATVLSSLATSTALFFRAVAENPSESSKFPRLMARAENLVVVLSDIKRDEKSDESSLSHHQLVPIRLWKSCFGSDEQLSRLSESVPPLVQMIKQKSLQKPSQLEESAQLLDRAADRLRKHTTKLVSELHH